MTVGCSPRTLPPGEGVGRRFRRLDADDVGSRTERVARRDATADSRPLPDRNVEHIEVGTTEREARELLRVEARAVGLHADHIDHVWRVLPRERGSAATWMAS